jgi:hypothetical protein
MRKVVLTEFLSLDGVMEEPSWSMPSLSPPELRPFCTGVVLLTYQAYHE